MFVCQMDWVFFLWILREKWTAVPMSKGYRGSTLQIWVFITSHRMLPTQSSWEIAQFCHHFKENAFHLFRLFSKKVPLRRDSRMVSWRWHKWNNCHDLKQISIFRTALSLHKYDLVCFCQLTKYITALHQHVNFGRLWTKRPFFKLDS